MTTCDDFFQKECEKIDAKCVNAAFELEIDPLNNTNLILKTSWGDTSVNLDKIVEDSETVTHLSLSPADSPAYIKYVNELGENECISGDDLSGIVKMVELKDVDSEQELMDGGAYIYNKSTNKFAPVDLKGFMNEVNNKIQALETWKNTVDTNINSLQESVRNISAVAVRPEGVPSDAVIAWANVNLYSDPTNTNSKQKGIYSHNPSTDTTADERFA